jgi:hypothetical protein
MQRRVAYCRAIRSCGITLAIVLVLLYAANMPFYSGSSVGPHWSWRMEHGRIKIERGASVAHESFYVAINSEGLRFRPEWRFDDLGNWYVNIPLWLPLGLVVLVTAGAWIVRRRSAQT